MPRPSKRVPPDTLGGRIRAARQLLHLSLADVAGTRYSTSLISQIERNRVEPSEESLQFLAERLKLPLQDLTILAKQHRDSEVEARQYKDYEEQRAQADQLLSRGYPRKALSLLQNLNIPRLPASLRWRMVALRGQCSFALRQFMAAQIDFFSAIALMPEMVPPDQYQEVVILHLHLAAASRELGQLKAAVQRFEAALALMNSSTPLRHVAEAHWGLALVAFEQAKRTSGETGSSSIDEQMMHSALKHAETARALYCSIEESLNEALLACQIGLIEQASGDLEGARTHLQEVLDTWAPLLEEFVNDPDVDPRRLKERANVVSAAACYLAGIELEVRNYDQALLSVEQAECAGHRSYTLRYAEAKMMRGRILETRDLHDSAAEEAFREATKVLASTDRVAAQMQAHGLLAHHLMKQGKLPEAEVELAKARQLSTIPFIFTGAPPFPEDTASDGL